MENISVLDKIINNQKAEEIAKLNAVEIVNNLFNELTERERDVLSRRFGLRKGDRETLEKVGGVHNLTRERIRQIEVASIRKLSQLEKLAGYVDILKKVISQLLEEHGGLMEREYLLNALVNFSSDGSKREDRTIHKNNLDFLISKLLHDEFEEVNNSKTFLDFYKLKYQTLDHLEELAKDLITKVEEAKKIFKTEELINLLTKLDSYNKNQEKFNIDYNIDISRILEGDLFEEKVEVINNNKILYSILKALREIEQNKFGYWGIYNCI